MVVESGVDECGSFVERNVIVINGGEREREKQTEN